MSSPRFPLRVNVGFLINQPIGTSRDIHFDFSKLNLPPDLALIAVQGLERISRTPQGLLVQADFKANMVCECVRCLTEFEQPLHTIFSELFAFKARGMSESGLLVPEDGNIDLAPLLREYMLLEIPIRPLCAPDCKGLCIDCGANLNIMTCEHQAGVVIE